jgi:hypothetical protein
MLEEKMPSATAGRVNLGEWKSVAVLVAPAKTNEINVQHIKAINLACWDAHQGPTRVISTGSVALPCAD